MIIKKKSGFQCSYCRSTYKEEGLAEACWDGHGIIYLPIAKDDLNKLLNFIYVGNRTVLSENLLEVIGRYNAHAAIRRMDERI